MFNVKNKDSVDFGQIMFAGTMIPTTAWPCKFGVKICSFSLI